MLPANLDVEEGNGEWRNIPLEGGITETPPFFKDFFFNFGTLSVLTAFAWNSKE